MKIKYINEKKNIYIYIHTTLLEKYPTFFLRKPGGFQ